MVFDDNLWHNYLTFFLMMSENPFSITCEKVGASDGSVNGLVANDFRIFKKLFDYDFKPIESALGIDCFTQISNYKAIVKNGPYVQSQCQRESKGAEQEA